MKDYLEKDIVKRPMTDTEYEASRDSLIGLQLAGKPKISDAEAFSILQKRTETEKEFTKALEFISAETSAQKVEAALTGKPFRIRWPAAGSVDTPCMPEPWHGASLPGRASDS